ncbi:carboxypeptidase-like regulatory domain-containing protein [Winogradskyella sp. PE311]|uniref:carboxypeptidase-like regulatory domain-containing protein n=1 Tax=Winogradskyella sp. PE311 TaxID=3366943 RepID=UPI0039812A0E
MNSTYIFKLPLSVCFFMLLSFSLNAQADYSVFKGKIIDSKSNRALEAANLKVSDGNIGTITNSEGEFVLKVPLTFLDSKLIVSLLGYTAREISLSELLKENNIIKLEEAVTKLSEVNISAYKDAENLVKRVFEDRDKNAEDRSLYMTAFYRESIKRRNRNVSLTEAIVDVLKRPYTSIQRDAIKLGKARKSTDYKRLDTVSVKLQGGPFSTIYLDIMKYPEYMFTNETISSYNFTFSQPTTLNNRSVYVVNFKPRNSGLNLNYNGTLFIDVESFALVSASYALDVSNKNKTRNLLVKKKPRNIEVYPIEANYRVDYQTKNDKWYFSYSSLDLKFKVKKKRQLFNKVYSLSSELAITDWEINVTDKKIIGKERLRPTVIIADAITGFSDPDFWGDYNLIEPDKSIEIAIEKIKKNIDKQKEN